MKKTIGIFGFGMKTVFSVFNYYYFVFIEIFILPKIFIFLVPKEKVESKPVLENSREILKSRLNQIQSKMSSKLEKNENREQSRDWIKKMSQELNERMKKNDNNVVDDSTARQQLMTSSIVRPNCLRCETSVTLMERVIVSGDVFHRFQFNYILYFIN